MGGWIKKNDRKYDAKKIYFLSVSDKCIVRRGIKYTDDETDVLDKWAI